MFPAMPKSIKKLMRLITSEPRAVATGQTLTSERRSAVYSRHIPNNTASLQLSFWPVATAPGSDVSQAPSSAVECSFWHSVYKQ
jgi:hypothetical protein